MSLKTDDAAFIREFGLAAFQDAPEKPQVKRLQPFKRDSVLWVSGQLAVYLAPLRSDNNFIRIQYLKSGRYAACKRSEAELVFTPDTYEPGAGREAVKRWKREKEEDEAKRRAASMEPAKPKRLKKNQSPGQQQVF